MCVVCVGVYTTDWHSRLRAPLDFNNGLPIGIFQRRQPLRVRYHYGAPKHPQRTGHSDALTTLSCEGHAHLISPCVHALPSSDFFALRRTHSPHPPHPPLISPYYTITAHRSISTLLACPLSLVQVDYPSVIRGVGLLLQPQPGDEVAHVYAMIDTKGRGVVTKDDVVNAVKKDAGVREIIRGSTTMRNLLHPTACAAAFSQLKVKRSGGIVQLPKFKKWVKTCVGTEVPPLADVIEEVFRLIDADGSGGVDKDEIFRAVRFDEVVRDVLQLADSLKRLLRPREFGEVFAQLDADGSGLVSLKEFRTFALGVSEDEIANPCLSSDGPQSADPVGDLFALLDKDYSGNVEKGEMLKAIRSDARVRELLRHTESLQVLLRPAAFEKAFADLDVDDSGLVWLDEFRAFAEGLSKRVPKPTSDDIISEVFALIDTNQSGDLDKEEILSAVHDNEAVRDIIHLSQHLLILLRPQTFDAAFAAMRTRKSGKVTLAEFRAFATGLVEAREEAALEGAATNARPVGGEEKRNGKEKRNEKGTGKGSANGKKQKQKQAAAARDASWRAPSGMASFLGDASHADSHKVALDDLFCEESPWFHRAVLCRGFKSHMTHAGELEQSGIVIGRRMRHTGAKSQNKPRAQARRGSAHAIKVDRHNSERKVVAAEARSVEEHQITFVDGASDWVPLSTETDAVGRTCRLADLKSPEDLQHCMWLRHFLGGAASASAEAHLSDRMLELLHTLQDHQAEIAKSAAHEHLVGQELVDHHVRVQLVHDGPWDHAVALEYHEKSADHLLAFQDGSTSCVNLSKVHYIVCDSAAGQTQSDQAVVDSHWVGDFLRKYMKAQEGGKVIATSRMAARAAAASAAAHADDTETFAVGGVAPLRTASMPFKVAERLKLEHAKDVKALEIAQNKIKQLEAAAMSIPEQSTADAQDMIKQLEAQLASQAMALEAATATPEAVPRPDSVVDQIFVSLDQDGSGSVPKMELYRAMKDDHQIRGRMETCEALKSLLHPRTFIGAFKLLDADGSGQVTLAEFRAFAFRAVTEKPTVTDVVGDVFALISAEVSGPVTKMGLLRAIKNNPQVRDALRLSPSMRDLLHPRKVLRAFKLLDVDGSGDITLDEFRVFASRVAESGAAAPEPDAIAELFAALDKGGDGTVEKREILVAVKSDAAVRDMLRASETLQVLLRPRAFAQAFKSLDAQSTGRVTLAQFRAFANGLANEATPSSVVAITSESKHGSTATNDIDALFALIDKDGTGTLEKREILRAVNSDASVRDMLKLSEPLKALLRPRAFAAAFKTLDGDKSGCVNLSEFRAFALNLTQGSATSKPDDVGEVFSLIDADGSGKVDKAEILRAVRNNAKVRDILSSSDSLKTLMKPRAFAEAFKKLDTNRSGDVTLAGFRTFAKGLSGGNTTTKNDDVAKVFALMDTDGSGMVDKAEILRAVRENAEVRDLLRASGDGLGALLRPRAFKAAFARLSTNAQGLVSIQDFRALAASLVTHPKSADAMAPGLEDRLPVAPGPLAARHCASLGLSGNSVTGNLLRVKWTHHNDWQLGLVVCFSGETKKHLVHYADGDAIWHDMKPLRHEVIDFESGQEEELKAVLWAVPYLENDIKVSELVASREHGDDKDLMAQVEREVRAELNLPAGANVFEQDDVAHEGYIQLAHRKLLLGRIRHSLRGAEMLPEHSPEHGDELVDELIRVEWSGGEWHAGIVEDYDAELGQHFIEYEDGDLQWHDLKATKFALIDVLDQTSLEGLDWAVDVVQNNMKHMIGSSGAVRHSKWVLLSKLYLIQVIDHPCSVRQSDGSWRTGIILELERESGRHLIEYSDSTVEWVVLRETEHRLLDATYIKEPAVVSWLSESLTAKAAERSARGISTKVAWTKLLAALLRGGDRSVSPDTDAIPGRQALALADADHAANLGLTGQALVGRRISVQWQDPNNAAGKWYDGKVEKHDAAKKLHLVAYDDGELKWEEMSTLHHRVHPQEGGGGMPTSMPAAHKQHAALLGLERENLVGHRVSVQWGDANDDTGGKWYDGVVKQFDGKLGLHLIKYDDGDAKWESMATLHHRVHGTRTRSAEGDQRALSPSAHPHHARHLGLEGAALVGHIINVQWAHTAAGNSNVRQFTHGFKFEFLRPWYISNAYVSTSFGPFLLTGPFLYPRIIHSGIMARLKSLTRKQGSTLLRMKMAKRSGRTLPPCITMF